MYKHSFIAKFLVVVMLISIFITPLSAFASETNKDDPQNDIINEWLEKGFIKGYEDGQVKPENYVSRVEFITMINACMGYTTLAEINFKDVKTTSWFYQEVRKAVAAGYIVGYEDNTFRGDKKISAVEACVIISRIKNLEGNAEGVKAFKNYESIPLWARDAVGAVAVAGYIDALGKDTFPSNMYITRLTAIIVLDSALNGKVEPIVEPVSPNTKPSSDTHHHDSDTTKHVNGVQISTPSAIIAVGNTYPLTAAVSPSDASNIKVTWSSSNTTVASISAEGIVTASATGSAIITVKTKDGGYTDKCDITVVDESEFIYNTTEIVGNNFEISDIDDFTKGAYKYISLVPDVGDGAITISKVDGQYPSEGYYMSQIFDVPDFEYMVASWNSDTPENTYVEIQARVLVNHFDSNNEPVQDWTNWLSWGKYSPHMERASADTNDTLAKTSTDELIIKGSKGETACKVQMRAILHTDDPEVAPVLRLVHGSLKNTLDGQSIEYIIRDKSEESCYKTIATPQYSQSVRDPRIAGSICSPTCITMLVNRNRLNEGIYPLLPEEVAQNNYDFNYGFGNWSFSVATAATYGYSGHVEYSTLEGLKNEIANGYPVAIGVRYSNTENGDYPYLEGASGNTRGHLITIIGFKMIDGVEYAISNDPFAPGGNDAVYREYKVDQLMNTWKANAAYFIHDKEDGAGLYPTMRLDATIKDTDVNGEYNIVYNDEILTVENFGGDIMYTVDNDETYSYFPKISGKNTLTFENDVIMNPNLKVYMITDTGKVYVAKVDASVKDTKRIIIEKSLNLKSGESKVLDVQWVPEGTAEESLKWISSNENVAIVDQNGKVTAVDKGNCIIKAQTDDGSIYSECAVAVTKVINVTGSVFSATTVDDFNSGVIENVEVTDTIGDGAIALSNEDGEYKTEGYYYSPEYSVSNFEYMLASWNADTPESTYIEIKARVLFNHKDSEGKDITTWSDWMSWGTCGTFGPKKAANTDSTLVNVDADVLTIKGSDGETANKVQFMAVLHTGDKNVTPVIRHITGSIKNTQQGQEIPYNIVNKNENMNNDNSVANVPLYCASSRYNGNTKYDMASGVAALINTQRFNTSEDYILPEEVAQNNYVSSNGGGFRNWSFNGSMAGDWGYYSRVEYSCLDAIKNEIANGYPVAARIDSNFSVITGFETRDGVEYALVNNYNDDEANPQLTSKPVSETEWDDIVTFIVHEKEQGAGTSPVKRIEAKLVATETPNEYKVTYNNGASEFDIKEFDGNVVYTSLGDTTYKFITDQTKSTLTLTQDEFDSANLKVYIITDYGYVYVATK